MKALSTLLLLAILILTVRNGMEIAKLRADVAGLQAQVAKQQRSADLLTEAMRSIEIARGALARLDTKEARTSLDAARKHWSEAARTAGETAGPALKWIESQISSLSKQAGKHSGEQK